MSGHGGFTSLDANLGSALWQYGSTDLAKIGELRDQAKDLGLGTTAKVDEYISDNLDDNFTRFIDSSPARNKSLESTLARFSAKYSGVDSRRIVPGEVFALSNLEIKLLGSADAVRGFIDTLMDEAAKRGVKMSRELAVKCFDKVALSDDFADYAKVKGTLGAEGVAAMREATLGAMKLVSEGKVDINDLTELANSVTCDETRVGDATRLYLSKLMHFAAENDLPQISELFDFKSTGKPVQDLEKLMRRSFELRCAIDDAVGEGAGFRRTLKRILVGSGWRYQECENFVETQSVANRATLVKLGKLLHSLNEFGRLTVHRHASNQLFSGKEWNTAMGFFKKGGEVSTLTKLGASAGISTKSVTDSTGVNASVRLGGEKSTRLVGKRAAALRFPPPRD